MPQRSQQRPHRDGHWLPLLVLGGLLAGCGATSSDPSDDDVSDAADVEVVVVDDRITILGIRSGDVLTGSVRVEALLSEISNPRGIEFYVDDQRVDTVLTEPWATTLDTASFDDGEHTLRVVVARISGNPVESGIVVRFDNAGPAVSMSSPGDGGELFATDDMRILLDVVDPSGVSAVTATIDELPVAIEGPPWAIRFALSSLALAPEDLPRTLAIEVTAVDTVGLTSASTFSLELRSRVAWQTRTLGEVWAPPAVDNANVAYFGSRDGVVYAVDAAGNQLWTWEAGAEVVVSPAISSAGHIVVSTGNNVASLDPVTGTPAWNIDAGATVGSAPGIADGLVIVGTYGNQILALDPTSGATLWTAPAADAVLSTPIVDAFGQVVFGSSDGSVYAVDSEAMGAELWTFQTGDKVWSSPTIAANGDVLVGSNDGYLYRVNRYGTFGWEFEARDQIWGAATEAADGSIFVASTFRRLYRLTADGTPLWENAYSGFAYATPAISRDGTVFVVSTDGVVHALDASGQELWSYATGSSANGSAVISPDGSLLFVGSNDRNMYALHTGLDGCGAPQMVDAGGVAMMKYEASRVDASPTQPGQSVDGVCSRAGVLPWTNVTWQEAQQACASIGLDLCPGATWETGCNGPGMADFPYGQNYDGAICVGDDYVSDGCTTGGCGARTTGEASQCVSGSQALDMAGNVAEWTLDQVTGGFLVRGGAYDETGDEHRCSNVNPDTHVVPGAERRADVGFRCCENP